VTPNQGGTWHFDRSSWCPGFVTEEYREDITESVDLEGVNNYDHTPTYHGGTPPGGQINEIERQQQTFLSVLERAGLSKILDNVSDIGID